jgi:hypothetical protein
MLRSSQAVFKSFIIETKILNPSAAQNRRERPFKNAVHKQHEILEIWMGWSFCCHFSVVGESFHSQFLLKKISS